jgi:DNA-binding Xre family transcriptional regulator
MNRIKQVLATKGIDELRPSKDLLEKLEIQVNSWNKFVQGKKDPELWQLKIIAEFLDCPIADLIESTNERAGV